MRLVVCLAILHFSQLLAKTPEYLACKWGMHEMMLILGGILALVSLVTTTTGTTHHHRGLPPKLPRTGRLSSGRTVWGWFGTAMLPEVVKFVLSAHIWEGFHSKSSDFGSSCLFFHCRSFLVGCISAVQVTVVMCPKTSDRELWSLNPAKNTAS